MLYLSLPVSDICNYRCRHCHIWMKEQSVDAISRERRIEIVQEFARLNPSGCVVLPGGEVTLDMDELLAVAGACRDAGLPCVIMTNGSRIDTPEAARVLVTSGVTFCCRFTRQPPSGTAQLHARAAGRLRRGDAGDPPARRSA